jgi:hypothetical protein
LAAVLPQMSYRGAVALTGVAGGGGVPDATVYPFILRALFASPSCLPPHRGLPAAMSTIRGALS